MPKRKHKKFSRPKKIFDIALLKEENDLIKKFGLKSRREVWRAAYAIAKIRNIAKELITAEEKKQQEFVSRQAEKGFDVQSIADILGLNKENYLKRRLQSIVVQKGLAKNYKQARQFITHRHVKVNGTIMNSPSHLTTVEEEAGVELTLKLPQKEMISAEEKEILSKIHHRGSAKAEEKSKETEEEKEE